MEKKRIYLDNAATTRVCDEAAAAALRVMTELYGNPSSTHTMGREAAAELKTAREEIAAALGAKPEEVYFTSGGTEGDNWAIRLGAHLMRRRGRHIISSMAEHDAVRRSLDALEAEGWEITRLKPNSLGGVDAADVEAALREDTALISLMLVNNETGAVTDIAAVSRMLKKRGSAALLHCDAVQGFLKLPFTVKSLGADMITVSGHKIHAPKGVGALYVKGGVKLPPLMLGGAQESSRRAGTEAMPLIAAFGEAARVGRAALSENSEKMLALRAHAVERLTALMPDIVIIGGGAPHILSISVPGGKSEVLMNRLEADGIFISKSSACKRGARSHVLEAMGLAPDVIDGALRIGLSRCTTEEELNYLASRLAQARQELFPRRG